MEGNERKSHFIFHELNTATIRHPFNWKVFKEQKVILQIMESIFPVDGCNGLDDKKWTHD